MNKLTFIKDLYLENKTSLLPSALWKVTKNISNLRLERVKKPLSVRLLSNNQLFIFYDKSNSYQEYFVNNSDFFDLILLNQKYYQEQLFKKDYTKYFKLAHNLKSIPNYTLDSNFEIRKVKASQAKLISEFISSCYPDLKPKPKTVINWSNHPTYDENLWIWIWDKSKDLPAALAISELDQSIKEGALEWIQVHPNYQGYGLGKKLVYLTLDQLSISADFATVGGKNPIALKLYQSCGFTNKENFYVFH